MAVIADLDARTAPCSPSEAAHYAGQLISFYPARELLDPKAFVAGLTAVLAIYPLDLVRWAAHPVTGLPSRRTFLPSIAEVRQDLDAEAARRARISANAHYAVQQARQRAAEAEEEARFNAERQPRAERAKAVMRLLRPWAAQSDEG